MLERRRDALPSAMRAEHAMLGLYALPLAEHRDALAAEVARLRKLFDDAGQGEHNVLALVDHYQAEAIEARAEVARLREAAAAVVACVGYDATMQRAVDRLASVLAEAKGAGR